MFAEWVPFGAGDVLWVESVEYPPTVGDGCGYEFWVTGRPMRAPSAGFWLVSGWELAAGTQELVRQRTICVATETPRARWRRLTPGPNLAARHGPKPLHLELSITNRGEPSPCARGCGTSRPLRTPRASARTV